MSSMCTHAHTHTHTPPTPPWLYPDVGACQQGRMVPESGSSRDISSRRKNFKTRKSKPSLHFSFWLQNTFEKWASLVTQTVKNLPAMWETWFHPWIGKSPFRREWLPTPNFLPREFHGQRSLAGYSPWGHKESDMT